MSNRKCTCGRLPHFAPPEKKRYTKRMEHGYSEQRSPRVRVGCHAGYRGEETPRWLEIGGRRLEVDDVVDRGLGPDHRYFKVRAGGAPGEYIPRHDQERDCWELTSFRNAG